MFELEVVIPRPDYKRCAGDADVMADYTQLACFSECYVEKKAVIQEVRNKKYQRVWLASLHIAKKNRTIEMINFFLRKNSRY